MIDGFLAQDIATFAATPTLTPSDRETLRQLCYLLQWCDTVDCECGRSAVYKVTAQVRAYAMYPDSRGFYWRDPDVRGGTRTEEQVLCERCTEFYKSMAGVVSVRLEML